MGTRGRHTGATSLVLLALVLTACQSERAPAQDPTPGAADPVALRFGVYGTSSEVATYTRMAEAFNATRDDIEVQVDSATDSATALAGMRAATAAPDVFLTDRTDLRQLQEQGYNQPVDELLDERGVDFGDVYQRDAIQAFSGDARLQCMPYGISPMVLYFNTDLIDPALLAEEGEEPPAPGDQWSFEEFTTAAEQASGRRTRGVHVNPTLVGLAPFILSGGGRVFNDDDEPTSLAFSDGGTTEALGVTLDLLRDDTVTFTAEQIARRSAVERFKAGRLGMITGFRSLVPELREAPGLRFEVAPMPALRAPRTIGDVSGLCLSSSTEHTPEAADFLAYAVSEEAVATVTESGSLVPANLEVASTDTFLQPGLEPASAEVFNEGVRYIVLQPQLEFGVQLRDAVQPTLDRLLYARVLDLEAITEEIDLASQAVLDPESLDTG